MENTTLIDKIYDIEYKFDEDIKFIKKYIKFSDKILELGSGTGRVLVELCKENYNIDGLDISKTGINATKIKLSKINKNTSLYISDMSDFNLDKKYDFIFCIFNSFMLLQSLEKQESCIKKTYEHLNEGGKVIFSISNPCFKRLNEEFSYVKHQKTIIDPETNNKIEKFEYNKYDLDKQLIYRTFYYDEINEGKVNRYVNNFIVRYLFKNEFVLLFEKNGIKIKEIYGNWDGKEWNSKSPSIIIIGEK